MKVTCENCGEVFDKIPAEVKRSKHHFCCVPCCTEWKRKRIIVNCHWCGKPVEKQPSQLEKYAHAFCSQKCSQTWQRERTPDVVCENCGKSFHKSPSALKRTKQNFCSQDCCKEWRTGRPRPEHGEKVRRALKGRKPSPQCLEAVARSSRRRLLDPEVQAKMQEGLRAYYAENPGPNVGRYGELNYNWRGGTSFEPYAPEFNKRLKKQIRERDHNACQLCGMTQQEHLAEFGRSLSIHHIDYDKQNCDPSNLITLCFRCNAQANGNRDFWEQFFGARVEAII